MPNTDKSKTRRAHSIRAEHLRTIDNVAEFNARALREIDGDLDEFLVDLDEFDAIDD